MADKTKCIVIWIGEPPAACDLCKSPITDTFIDGRTVYGPWANMCPTCHSYNGVGLGQGKGQKFVLTNDKFIKEI